LTYSMNHKINLYLWCIFVGSLNCSWLISFYDM
jgi:hypothetical protein